MLVKPIATSTAIVLLTVRGILLWVVLPLGFVAWLLVFGWLRRVGLPRFLGWLDLNLVAGLQRSVFRPWITHPTIDAVPISRIRDVEHRVSVVLDPL